MSYRMTYFKSIVEMKLFLYLLILSSINVTFQKQTIEEQINSLSPTVKPTKVSAKSMYPYTSFIILLIMLSIFSCLYCFLFFCIWGKPKKSIDYKNLESRNERREKSTEIRTIRSPIDITTFMDELEESDRAAKNAEKNADKSNANLKDSNKTTINKPLEDTKSNKPIEKNEENRNNKNTDNNNSKLEKKESDTLSIKPDTDHESYLKEKKESDSSNIIEDTDHESYLKEEEFEENESYADSYTVEENKEHDIDLLNR